MQYQRLGDWLIQKGLLEPEQLSQAIAAQSATSQRLGKVLVDLGFVSEDQITQCLAEQYDLPMADLAKLRCQKPALALMPPTFALARCVLPFKLTDSELHCIIADPLDIPATDEIAASAGKKVVLSLAAPTALWNAVVKHYRLPRSAMKGEQPEKPKPAPKLADDRDRRELLFRLQSSATEATLWEKFAGGSN